MVFERALVVGKLRDKLQSAMFGALLAIPILWGTDRQPIDSDQLSFHTTISLLLLVSLLVSLLVYCLGCFQRFKHLLIPIETTA
jgi:hypothetical protein